MIYMLSAGFIIFLSYSSIHSFLVELVGKNLPYLFTAFVCFTL